MNKKPVISVILPASGEADAVKTAMTSILKQTYSDWELVIIDDESFDGSAELCEALAAGERRIKVIHTENEGASHARNAGISVAEGEWITFLNAGESFTANAFEKMMEYADGADVISCTRMYYSWMYPTNPHGTEVWNVQIHTEAVTELLKDGCLRTVRGKLYRRSRLRALFDENTFGMAEFLYNSENLSGFENIHIIPILGYISDKNTWKTETSVNDMSYAEVCRRIWTNLVSSLPFSTAVSWANRELMNSLTNYVYRFVNSGFGITDFEKGLIIQLMQEDALTPEIRKIPTEDLGVTERLNWQIFCSGTPEEVIVGFSEDAYRKRAEKYGTEGSRRPGDIVKKGMVLRSFKIMLAGLPMEVLHRYDLIKDACRDYRIPDDMETVISFVTTEARMQFSKDCIKDEAGNAIADDEAELDATHYNLYEKLPEFDAFWLHSVIVERQGKAYAFTAKPGTGKSTHGKLWLKAFPDARIINGDNAIVRRQPDGTFYAYGTPFCGKEGYHVNIGVPLKGICFLSRGKVNKIRPLDPDYAVNCLYRDNFCVLPSNAEAHRRLYIQLTQQVPCYVLECNMDVEAARVAWQGMNGTDEW